MLRDAWFIARKDVQYLITKRETLLWTFVMPIVFFYFIGTITGGFSGTGTADADRLTVRIEPGAGFLAESLTVRYERAGFEVVRADTGAAFERATRRLAIPAGFTDSIVAGRKVKLEFRRRGEGLGSEYDAFRVQRGTYTMLADLATVRVTNGAVTPAAMESLAALPRAIELDVRAAGRRAEAPTGFAQAIPGTMVMFTLMVLLTSGAVLLVVERRAGLLRRLAATPISRGAVVLGKWGGRMILAGVQIGFAMLAGALLFGLDWGPDVGAVIGLLAVYAGFTAALGIVLGTLARTEGQAVGIGVLSANLLAALGGCWWPIEVTPEWMQRLSLGLPTGVAMDAMHKLVNFQLGAETAVPHAIGLALAGLVAGWAAARIFRYD